MASKIPNAKLILDYKLVYGVNPPIETISMLKNISKEHIIYELAALNYRLKPKHRIYFDMSFETQKKELKYFCGSTMLHRKYATVAEKFSKNNDYPIIFTRQTCLYALEEIINSDLKSISDFNIRDEEVCGTVMDYLLAINFIISNIKPIDDENEINFEKLNPRLIPLNELSIESHPLFTGYRGYKLMGYIQTQSDLDLHLQDYFNKTYGINNEQFIFHVLSMYGNNSAKNPDYEFCYIVPDKLKFLFEALSNKYYNPDTFKLLSQKKSPFIKGLRGEYLISDNTFLIEKTYNQFLNDFWFDHIKNIKDENDKNKFTIQYYRSIFGYFFEEYLSEILKEIFSNLKFSKLVLFKELNIKTSKGTVEIADVYLRYLNKILIGQVKSSSIYDEEKFGGDIESLYKNDRNKFFENFGVNQIIESIKNMDTFMHTIDSDYPVNRIRKVYPCIIVNDKALQTAFMADVFNLRFKELLQGIKIQKMKIYPLSIIHISDIENLETAIKHDPKKIWELLKDNVSDKNFIPAFDDTVRKLLISPLPAQRIMDFYKNLITRNTLN